MSDDDSSTDLPDAEDRPRCDLEGCDEPGYARYRHNREDRWIDACAPHRPLGPERLTSYHTARHKQYPASTPSEVQNPDAFIRQGGSA